MFTALIVVSGCAAGSGSGGCTLIGAPVGVSLDIEPPLAARIAHAGMTICANGTCHTSDVSLGPATEARGTPCAAVRPGDPCAASAVTIGGLHGFAGVPGLTKRPVLVTVVLRDGAGRRIVDQRVTVNPKGAFPNGPHCGEGGPQAGVIVGGGGRVRARP